MSKDVNINVYRITLPATDYHDFVVKIEKKQKMPLKRIFTFKRTCDNPKDPSNHDYWQCSFAEKKLFQIAPQKKIE
jgi:argonaute-like protein implicated in RNA metabolism and viral defense